MDLRGTDPESYITEYPLVYEENRGATRLPRPAEVLICSACPPSWSLISSTLARSAP